MWYHIKRKSDNKYLTKMRLNFWESNEWSENIESADKLVRGRCDSFIRAFRDKDEFEVIPV